MTGGGGEKLPVGKLPQDTLKKIVLRHLGAHRDDILLKPRVGEDAGAVRAGGRVYILSIDPITGSREMVGWLAVHASANDVAVCGGRPAWFSPTVLLPSGSTEEDVADVVRQIDRAAKSLGVGVVTGHSEIAPYTSSPIVIGHMMGPLLGGRLITSSNAKVGDWIVMTKSAAMEGTAILASDFEDILRRKGVGESDIATARRYFRKISVVAEALYLTRNGRVNAMHDATEGGVLGGLYELAEASGTGFRVMADEIPVTPVTARICRALEIDPLRLVSSGALLASVPRLDVRLLRRVRAKPIGKIVHRRHGRLVIGRDGVRELDEPVQDHLWKIIERKI